MATKTEKRHAEKRKQELKEAKERLENLTQNQIYQLENYTVYQILYANDAACNQVKFLGDTLKTIPYKSKGAQIKYNALMKRVNAYWEMVNASDINQDSLAEMFANMDGYTDKHIDNFRNAVDDVLSTKNVEQHSWVAQVETALVMCQYAVQIGMDLLSRLKHLPNTHPMTISKLLIVEILRVMDDFSKFVTDAAHLGNTVINLNDEPTVQDAFRALNKAYIKPENYTKALAAANEENYAEGRMLL